MHHLPVLIICKLNLMIIVKIHLFTFAVSNIMEKGRIKRILLAVWPMVIAILVFFLVRIAVNNPDLTEKYYSDGFYPVIASTFSSVSRISPFSLWDVFWFVSILIFLAGVVIVILRRMKFRIFCLKVARIIALMYAFFYLSWGFNYFRPDIGKRIGLDIMKVDEKLFRSMLDSVIILTNHNYVTVAATDYSEINHKVEESYSANAGMLDINYPNGYRRPKSMLFSNLIAKFGISGYFGPFFNEINLNSRLLPMEYPFLLAHEKAHQFGISGEADANLVAFIICTSSDDRRLKYSGYLALLLYFLEDAQYFRDYREFLGKLDKPVIDELRFRQQYYFGLQNEAMGKAHETVYDAYLKSNHVPHGVENYNQVVELAISWITNESKLTE
ncbi:MAG: hypothetical protein A2X05_04970 [Bacteroidetes bacterium GWE2_41_25]|nr:MAG: hypothetical protein A2X06_11540 [Bacteroidetes bacterium GWC2_40_22]OFX93480.1 MAG: hypothetical protein A2X05_04970 [Bacteroidetes bacterium GWE2_41_25]HBQ81398.1 hypothetical protein [Bacteroidales bacterium]